MKQINGINEISGIREDAKLLPMAKISGREFLVDVERRELRDFNNPENIIRMHSSLGRQLVREMHGTQWNSMGVSTGTRTGTGTDRGMEV